MSLHVLSSYAFGDTTARYWQDDAGHVSLDLIPTALLGKAADRRTTLAGLPEIDAIPNSIAPDAIVIDPLVHVKIVGDAYPGAFAQGRTMRNGPSAMAFTLRSQRTERQGGETAVVTTLTSPAGVELEHRLIAHDEKAAFVVNTKIVNSSVTAITLEMLTSFSLGRITPFAPEDAPNQLVVHRFRSVWSAEGRLDTQSIERLHLERSWSGAGAFSERFGQVGSMPVRGWFPFVAVEDREAGVVWGAQLAWAGSWQMEVFRQDDQVAISGGLADREFGHWMKRLEPGESLAAPAAHIACVHGDLDDLCDRLTELQRQPLEQQPAVERELPIVFNEWCTTWGDPSHDNLVAIANSLKGAGVTFLVIDAGWYKTDAGDWNNGHGDWVPSRKLFPNGLGAVADAIREQGLIPGLWYEFETVGEASTAFGMIDHLLKRDGFPITVRSRRFWDFNDPYVVEYLSDRVIGLLESAGFGYLKVDYNETIGIGSDDRDSQGEGLRKQIEGVYRFFDLIRKRMPELVIECCSSGGHRLEPSMLGRTAMGSFSDAHELREIPVIAANLHRLMLPQQSQVWAVLHPADSMRRLLYSLTATFLGRMGLSGGIHELSVLQRELMFQAIRLYRRTAPVIRDGKSRRFGAISESWRHLEGWQSVRQVAGNRGLVVMHAFGKAPKEVRVPLEGDGWRIVEILKNEGDRAARIETGHVMWEPAGEFCGMVVLLER